MNAHIISIGDEILIGQIVNTNAAWMAEELNQVGVHVDQIVTIADGHEAIKDAVAQAEKEADIILITGGLGPTKDDITKKALAEYFGLEMAYHEPSFNNIQTLFAQFGREPDDRYKIQAEMPVGADIMINKVGTASGMWFQKNGKVTVSMPGVPREMKYLMSKEVLPRLHEHFSTPTILHKTLLTTGKGETDLSGLLSELEDGLPENIKLAYLPNTLKGQVRLRLSARGEDEAVLQKQLDENAIKITKLLGTLVFGEGKQTLSESIGLLLKNKNATLGIAESCTGGNVAHHITLVPGCSDYFKGSVVTYANELKMKILGVKKSTLDEYGAVSEQTVKEMVLGAIQNIGVDYAVATSGIAGPGGGHPDKPVGTIWIAVGDKDKVFTKKLQLGKDRERNIQLTTTIVMNTLRRFLLDDLDVDKITSYLG
ncbi:MAG: competence/damage-inducible protein A [Aureispira sp.]|nr:competence/damage-inducible protein A [Aureispira sp.]